MIAALRRRPLCGLALATVLASALAPAAAAGADLTGTWEIAVSGGTAAGDGGRITIFREEGRLMGEMTFTDVSAGVTATERCALRVAGEVVSIDCRVLTPDPATYAPDNFWLRIRGPDLMEGRMFSLTGGPARFTRREVPLS